MITKDLKEMVTAYREANKFLPGAVVLNEKDIPEILELYEEVMLPDQYTVFKECVLADSAALGSSRIFNMRSVKLINLLIVFF